MKPNPYDHPPPMHLKIFDPDQPLADGDPNTGTIHRCDLCCCYGRWDARWKWFGSIDDDCDGEILKCCGCREIGDTEAKQLLREKLQKPASSEF